jgi:hypothetical protein
MFWCQNMLYVFAVFLLVEGICMKSSLGTLQLFFTRVEDCSFRTITYVLFDSLFGAEQREFHE